MVDSHTVLKLKEKHGFRRFRVERASIDTFDKFSTFLADSAKWDHSERVINFGKYEGKTFTWVKENDESYSNWCQAIEDPTPAILDFQIYLNGQIIRYKDEDNDWCVLHPENYDDFYHQTSGDKTVMLRRPTAAPGKDLGADEHNWVDVILRCMQVVKVLFLCVDDPEMAKDQMKAALWHGAEAFFGLLDRMDKSWLSKLTHAFMQWNHFRWGRICWWQKIDFVFRDLAVLCADEPTMQLPIEQMTAALSKLDSMTEVDDMDVESNLKQLEQFAEIRMAVAAFVAAFMTIPDTRRFVILAEFVENDHNKIILYLKTTNIWSFIMHLIHTDNFDGLNRRIGCDSCKKEQFFGLRFQEKKQDFCAKCYLLRQGASGSKKDCELVFPESHPLRTAVHLLHSLMEMPVVFDGRNFHFGLDGASGLVQSSWRNECRCCYCLGKLPENSLFDEDWGYNYLADC